MIAKSVVTSRPKVPPGVKRSWIQRNCVSVATGHSHSQALYQRPSIHSTALARFFGSRRHPGEIGSDRDHDHRADDERRQPDVPAAAFDAAGEEIAGQDG